MYQKVPGVPVPPINYSYKYPFHEMEPGDSFFVPTPEGGHRALLQIAVRQAIIGATARRPRQRGGKGATFTVRQVDGGVRCWRVA